MIAGFKRERSTNKQDTLALKRIPGRVYIVGLIASIYRAGAPRQPGDEEMPTGKKQREEGQGKQEYRE